MHGRSDADESMLVQHFFPADLTSTSNSFKGSLAGKTLDDVACGVLKPEITTDASLADVIYLIQDAGFQILAARLFTFSHAEAEEFLAVYKGVLPEHPAMVSHFCSGPLIALALQHPEKDSVRKLREICGPIDPDIARSLRPYTLRAKFGKTRVSNAIHCSDLDEDGVLECEYIFKIVL
ncbi:unnamed protein product [Cyprideis torosa]|nr:unnamed protein product [Cyprideis torosa]CAG0908376.1 unnamed protein product [Cyprideis torosa]